MTDEQVAALAEVFADPQVARQVVADAGVPVPDVPWGAQSARVFWRAVADLLGHGVAADGAAALLAVVRRHFPGNPVFAGAAMETSTPAVTGGPVSGLRVRSAYLDQVRQIAPPRLVGRELELAQLTEFCTARDDVSAGSYVWWRAGAWTGKSALMSSFVLAPPPGIRVVSFFVTARYAGNSDRAAFVEIVSEQLVEILGESVPLFQDPARQERQWFRMFADAAALCRDRDQRLVLVVDGLDEDRGVTGPGARSIAGLLPSAPPHGARVIVAGRPDPPIPGDVPAHHPLRDPRIVQVLNRSEYAATIKADMVADLERLLGGGPLEVDLLGLVTAAGGGLSGRDLEELVADPKVTEYRIENLLSTIVGRCFSSRAAQWNPSQGPRVYLVGHEDLAQTAARAYGSVRLAGYRDRIHTWAEGYRQRRWPLNTPEYLLRGYYRLLLDIGDLTHAIDCATDQARHDWMLDLTGGDTAALAEITETQNVLMAQDAPDLPAMAHLAVQRQRIADRNSHIPTSLPAVWATLGHTTRAEQLARAITDPGSQAQALAELAGALARARENVRAVQVAARAEQLACGMADPFRQARALVEVAGVLAQAGEHARAQQVANDIKVQSSQARALVEVAGVLAQAGEHARAQQVANDIADPYFRAGALGEVAGALARAGEHDRAMQIATRAEQVARAIADPGSQTGALVEVARALARAGEHVRAMQGARGVTDPFLQARTLVEVAGALARAGEHDRAMQVATRAEQVARAIIDSHSQVRALVEVACALARVGQHGHAREVATRAEQVARAITDSDSQVRALVEVARALARAGDHARAQQVAGNVTDPNLKAQVLVEVAGALARAGEHAHAVQVASRAELVARGSAISGSEVRILVEVAGVLARAGEHARAVQVARDITNPDFRVRALVEVASAFAQAGKPGQAVQVATRAEQVARGIADPGFRAQVLVKVAGALTLADARRRATHLLGSALGLGDWTRLPLAAIADINQDVINAIGRAAASNGNG